VSAGPGAGHYTASSSSSVEWCLITFKGFTTFYATFKVLSQHLPLQPENFIQGLPNKKQLYKPLHLDILLYSEDFFINLDRDAGSPQ